jgi:hypothetical protein
MMPRQNLIISGLLRTSSLIASWDLILFAHLLVAPLIREERKLIETSFNIQIPWSKAWIQTSGILSQMRRWSQNNWVIPGKSTRIECPAC